jgi:hypothetical protein
VNGNNNKASLFAMRLHNLNVDGNQVVLAKEITINNSEIRLLVRLSIFSLWRFNL